MMKMNDMFRSRKAMDDKTMTVIIIVTASILGLIAVAAVVSRILKGAL